MNKQEKDMYLICTILLVITFFGIILLSFPGINITGLVALESEDKTEFVYEPPEIITQEVALDALLKAEEDLQEMVSFNIDNDLIKDMLLQAKRNFVGDDFSVFKEESKKIEDALKQEYIKNELAQVFSITPEYEEVKTNYSEVIRLTQLIAFKKQQAYKILDALSLLEEKEKAYKEGKEYNPKTSTKDLTGLVFRNKTDSGADTSEARELLDNARKAFEEGRYGEAEDYIEEADLKLEEAFLENKRIKGLIKLGKNFFQRYWWQIILVVIILIIITPPTIKKIKLKLARKKLETLRLELQTITKLIKKAQEDCFRDKKITEATYKIRVDKFRSRMAEIKHTIPVLEFIVFGKRKKKKPEKKKGILEVK